MRLAGKVRLWAAAGAMALAAAGPAWPAEILIGVEESNYMPHHAVDGGTYIGLGRELFDAFARGQGLTPVYQPLPIKRLYQALVGSEIDLKYPDSREWAPAAKKDAAVRYSRALVPFTDGLLVRPEFITEPEQVSEFGMLLGFTPVMYKARLAAGSMSVTEVGNLSQLVQMAQQGRIQAVLGNVDVIRNTMRLLRLPPDALIYASALPHHSGHYHASSVRNPELVARLDAWAETNRGRIAGLLARFDVIERP